MKVIVVGKTDSVLTLNKIGVPIRGKVEAVLNIENAEQQNEIDGLKDAGFIDIITTGKAVSIKQKSEKKLVESQEEEKEGQREENPIQQPKKHKGRPKGSKNKKTETKKVKEAQEENQKMGSKVVIGTGSGIIEGKMVKSVIQDIPDSERTKESVDALKKIEEEERREEEEIDEEDLDPSEQVGRPAIISTGRGTKEIRMVNSIIPEQEQIKENDSFIDLDISGKDISDAFVDTTEDEDPSIEK